MNKTFRLFLRNLSLRKAVNYLYHNSPYSVDIPNSGLFEYLFRKSAAYPNRIALVSNGCTFCQFTIYCLMDHPAYNLGKSIFYVISTRCITQKFLNSIQPVFAMIKTKIDKGFQRSLFEPKLGSVQTTLSNAVFRYVLSYSYFGISHRRYGD